MDTIKSSSDISILFSEGRRVKTPDVMVIIKRNEKQHDPRGRVAFIAGKKLGNAVTRNRAKRVIRAAYRAIEGELQTGFLVVISARHDICSAKSTDGGLELREAFERLSMYKKKNDK